MSDHSTFRTSEHAIRNPSLVSVAPSRPHENRPPARAVPLQISNFRPSPVEGRSKLSCSASRWRSIFGCPHSSTTDQHEATAVCLRGSEAVCDGRQEGDRVADGQDSSEYQGRVQHRRCRSRVGDPVLIVSIHRHVGRTDLESRFHALPIEPSEALFPNDLEALGGPLALCMGTQSVHHHVMLDGTAVRGMTATDDRIGAQGKPEPISGLKGGRKRLRFVDLEQPVTVVRLTCGKDEKHARAGSILPLPVSSSIATPAQRGHAVGARPDGAPRPRHSAK